MNRYYILITLIFVMASCGKRVIVQEVPVVTEHTTVQHRTDIVRDTLMMRDSIYHYVKGDTVIIERWHHVIGVNKMVVTDTVRDTIPKVVTVTKTEVREVNRLHWWQKALMWLGVLLGAWGGFRIWRELKI